MKEFNVTAQVYKLYDPHKQNLLINHIFVANSSEDAIEQFKNLYWGSIEFHVVKIHSAEEIPQNAA
jgi:hypothetical protein